LKFKFALGVEEMEFRIEKKDPIRVLGVSAPISSDITEAYEEGEALWMKVLFEGAPKDADGDYVDIGPLCKELNAAANAQHPPIYNGFFAIEIERGNDNSCEYMIAAASTLPEGGNLKEYIIPAHTWAVFPGKNFFADEHSTIESAIKHEERIYTEWLPTSGYEIADRLDVSFTFATEDLANMPFERWLPVRKVDNMLI